METHDSSAAIYSEAKSEYTKQLIFNFQPVLLRFFLDRYNETKTAPSVISKTKSPLSEFQESLSQIPDWNIDKVQREASSLLHAIHCDYIEDLITAVFIAHTKILSAIRLHSKPRRKINITVPKPDHFIHRTMSESSRLLWSNVYLFNDSVSSLERQKNVNEVNKLLEEGVLQAIRNLLPVKSILRDSLQDDEDDIIVHTALLTETPEAPAVTPETPAVTPQTPAMTPEAPAMTPQTPAVTSDPPVKKPLVENTLFIDTEKSVGFTGIDSVFGTSGEAELRPSTDEADELKIIGEFEELNLNEIEDLDAPPSMLTPLAADDYESL